MPKYSIGLDYGTNSVRALIVDCADGREVATAVADYRSGDHGVILDQQDPNLARQHPGDYIEGLHECVQAALDQARANVNGFNENDIVGIGVDTTGSSPLPADVQGIPLGMLPEWRDNPHAQCWLWKDHTSAAEAQQITELAKDRREPYLDKCGGTYSSEWFWSKILRCSRVAPDVFAAAHSWIELQDFVPGWLTGRTANPARGICAAGHKAMYSRDWGGLPSRDFLEKLGDGLAGLRDRLYDETLTADTKCGGLTADIGLPLGTPVAVGVMDAHAGAVGSGIKPGTLVKIMGTSTCDIMVADGKVPDIPGVCGIVPGSVIPGMLGIEAGQSAVGDLFNWAAKQLAPHMTQEELNTAASQLRPGATGLLALDWNNGNRTILVDPLLSGLLIGQSLQTTAVEIYRAMIEATAFGALAIINRIEDYGVKVDQIVTGGGIAEKSPLTMQIYADVCGRPIKLSRSNQTCALGACIFGSIAGGVHDSTTSAIEAMTGTKDVVYVPNSDAVQIYARLYELYKDLHDSFGTKGLNPEMTHVMKGLINIRQEVRQS